MRVECACSMLAYGCEVWKMTPKLMTTIRGWNAGCVALITGNSVRSQTVDPAITWPSTWWGGVSRAVWLER